MTPFRGEDRRRVLDDLCEEWRSCRAEGAPRMVLFEGRPEVGKTRIVREFFHELAKDHPKPTFWPDRIDLEPGRALEDRGRIVPRTIGWDGYVRKAKQDRNRWSSRPQEHLRGLTYHPITKNLGPQERS